MSIMDPAMIFLALVALAFILYGLGLKSQSINIGLSGFAGYGGVTTVTASEGVSANPSILAAQPATLTTRTDGTHGTLTMTNSGHGITTGQRIDLYWAAGRVHSVTVGTVAGTSVPFTVAASQTVLPIATTAVVVGVPVSVAFNIVGDNMQTLSAFCGSANIQFTIVNGGGDLFGDYQPANVPYAWFVGNGSVNPLAGVTSTLIWVSHDDVVGSHDDVSVDCLTN